MKYLGFVWALLAGLLFVPPLYGQVERSLITKNFNFQDGVYLTHHAFRTNTPDLNWEDVEARWYTNPQTFLVQMEYLQLKNQAPVLLPDSIWGFCLQGIPYVRLSRNWIPKELATFAPLQLRGRICFFSFNKKDTTEVLITAYNPANGLPFRQGLVNKEMDVNCQKILLFETGEVADFTRENLIAWIGDDSDLVEAVKALSEEELKTKLFKSLLIYVDRNEIYIP